MFAKHEMGAYCIESYGQITTGAIVPPVNELWEEVEQWLSENNDEWADMPPPPEPSLDEIFQQIEEQRLRAYANPVTGSDRYFAEAVRLDAMGNSEGAQVAREMGAARYNDIRNEYPWPVTEIE